VSIAIAIDTPDDQAEMLGGIIVGRGLSGDHLPAPVAGDAGAELEDMASRVLSTVEGAEHSACLDHLPRLGLLGAAIAGADDKTPVLHLRRLPR
jgi:hypothetical protein